MSYIKTFTDAPLVNRIICETWGDIAFDVGANAGYVSDLLARTFTTVVSIEPAVESYVHIPEKHNVIALNVAASDHVGTVSLGVKELTKTKGELFTPTPLDPDWGPTVGERTVKCTTLDTLAVEYGYPDFVKIDTEGHEKLIVEGAAEVFMRYPRFVIEIHSAAYGAAIKKYFDNIHAEYEDILFWDKAQHAEWNPNHYWMVSTL